MHVQHRNAKRFQSKALRITEAPWYVPNTVILKDLQIPTVLRSTQSLNRNDDQESSWDKVRDSFTSIVNLVLHSLLTEKILTNISRFEMF
jgi:hypothetical protein